MLRVRERGHAVGVAANDQCWEKDLVEAVADVEGIAGVEVGANDGGIGFADSVRAREKRSGSADLEKQ
jgi:hypothetical protein